MHKMVVFDSSRAAAGYGVNKTNQRHAPQKNIGVPVKLGQKSQEREHVRAEKAESAVGHR